MSRILLGFLCGILLAGLRRAPGIEILELPSVVAMAGYGTRALALALAALAVLLARRSLGGSSRPNADLLAAAALGVLAEGLHADLRPEGASAMLLLALVALAILLLRERQGPPATPPPEGERSLAGPLTIAGFGLALGMEGLARLVLRIGRGTAAEATVVGAVVLLAAAFGGVAFAGALRGGARDRARGGAALVAALVGGLALDAGMVAMAGIAVPRGRSEFLLRFGLSPSYAGELHCTALVAAVVFILPAFALGTTLACARRRSELTGLLIGGAAGLVMVPLLLEGSAATAAELAELPHSTQLLTFAHYALLLAAVAALLERPSSLTRRLPVALLALLLAVAGMQPLSRVIVLPWERFPATLRFAGEIPEGQLLILRSTSGIDRVLLDHRTIATLAPDAAGGRGEATRIRTAFDLLSGEVRERGARVLFVGQLTPGRVSGLAEQGVTRLDRSAAWWRVMPALEERLGVTSLLEEEPAGEVLSPASAAERVAEGSYDLVLVPAIAGSRPPRLPRVHPPAGTVVVAWLDPTTELAHLPFSGPVVVDTHGVEEFGVALVFGAELDTTRQSDRPACVETGAPLDPPPLRSWAFEREAPRRRRALASTLRRLADANADGEWRLLLEGLALHAAGQLESSPWESPAQRTELVPEALAELHEAATLGTPDPLTREVWNGLAHVLVGKRDVEGIWRWIEPVAAYWSHWPAGELALAHADIESLEYEAAAQRLAALVDPRPGEARLRTALRRARLDLARAWIAEGELEKGRGLARELLVEDPGDGEAAKLIAEKEEHDG